MEANTGTRPVAEQHRFDVAALEAYLRANLPGFAGPLSVEQFKGGQSNPTYKLTTPSRHYVMRAKPGPVAKLLPSAHAIEREFAVMRALHGTDVPVARMHVLCDDESVIGRAFYIMEYRWKSCLPSTCDWMPPSWTQALSAHSPGCAGPAAAADRARPAHRRPDLE